MAASEIILESIVCKQAAINIYPTDPDELFNTCWLKIREKELKTPGWVPDNPKHYFLRMMKNKVIDWRKEKKLLRLSDITEKAVELDSPRNDSRPNEDFVLEWLESPSKNENELFLKNILTLDLRIKNTSHAIKMAKISRKAFYHYLKIAKKKLYDDYHAANTHNVSSNSLV